MDEDDEFGDLYSDVLQPFQPPVVLTPPPPSPAHRSIDLNLRSQDQDGVEANSASVSRVLDNDASKLSVTLTQDATRQTIGDDGGGGDDKDMNFDIEEPDADFAPTIPGLFVAASEGGALPCLATDRGVTQVTTGIEQLGGDGGYGGHGEGDDWDSDSEDDLQIVLNDSSRNVMPGADRKSRMGDNEDEDDEDDEDDEEPLVIVADTDPNQPMEEQPWGEDGLQVVDGDGKDGGEAGKGSGPGGATGPPKAGYSSHGYHPFHSQFKYVRPGAAPIRGGAASTGGISSGQVRPSANLVPVAGRGRGDWRPMGMRNASAAQKGFHQSWGSNIAGRGLDFTLPSHKTIFEVDIESFEENPWKYPGVDITDYFNFGLDEDSWKDYCKQLDQHRIETTMQSRIRVYESGRTDQGYDPDLPPELAAATGAQGAPVDSSNLVKPGTAQGDSTKVPAHVRPSLPPGRPIPVETGSGERLPSIDTRAPRMRDLDAIIEIVCQDSHEDKPLCENGAEQADSSLPGENVSFETGNTNRGRPDMELVERSPAQDELREKQVDGISSSTDSGQSFRSSSPLGDRATRSSSVGRKYVGGEASKDAEIEKHKLSSSVPQSAVQEDDGGELKTERSSESSKARSENHRDYLQLKDGAEEEVSQDKHYARPDSNRKQHDNNGPHHNRKNQDRGKEMERTRGGSRGGRENSFPHPESDSSYSYSIASRKDFDQRKEQDGDGGIWRRKEDDPYSRRGGDDGSRKRDREDDPGSRQRGKVRESALRNKDDHVSRKHLDDVCMRNSYEVDDHISKRRKDEEYMRRSRPEKTEISYGQRESISRLKQRDRDDRLEHQKRDIQHKIRDDYDDHSSLRHRDEIYMQRDGNERMRERDDIDRLKLIHEDGLSAGGRERQVAARGHRGSEDRSSRMKDEYKASDREHLSKDTTRHTKQTKRREYPGEESSSHHRGHKDFYARTDNIVNNEKKPRQERAGAKSDKVVSDTLDAQRLQDIKHKDSRRKIKEQREGSESSRSKQGEHNGSSEVTGSKRTNEARNSRSEILQQPNATKKHKENASSGDDLQDSKRGRTKLERWSSQKERYDAVPAKSSSITLKHQVNEKSSNGRLSETVPICKNRDVTEEKSGHDLAETEDGTEKVAGDPHLDTVEKLKKRSERFKLPMPTEKDPTVVKKIECAMLHSVKIEGPVDSEVKVERPARKRRWTSS